MEKVIGARCIQRDDPNTCLLVERDGHLRCKLLCSGEVGALGWGDACHCEQTVEPPGWNPLKALLLAFMTGCSALDQGLDHQPISLKQKKKSQIDLGKQGR